MRITICLVALILLSSPGRAQDLVLNEVLYDPPGPDTGLEFVELYNPTSAAVELSGLRLEFVNGAEPDSPQVVWVGGAGELAPGAFYLIGADAVPGRADPLDGSLQNGPDALWLVRDDGAVDRLAWGELEGMGEGLPALDASAASLGRKPDGRDSDDNAADWVILDPPTPGWPNARLQRIRPLGLKAEPPWSGEEGEVRLELSALAEGTLERQEATLRWWLDGRLVGESVVRAAAADTLVQELRLWLARGRHRVAAVTRVEADRPDSLVLGHQVGHADVILNEVMAAPPPGQPEWIELRSIAAVTIDLGGWSIADASRRPSPLEAPVLLAPGAFAVLSADAEAMGVGHDLPVDVPVLEPEGSWPTLNNGSSGGELADEVFLYDAEGVVVDHLGYGTELIGSEGRSIERGQVGPDGTTGWFVSPGAPTPGRANAAAAAPLPPTGLALHPNPFSPDGDGEADVLHVLLRRPPVESSIVAEVFDLTGETVRVLGSGSSSSGALQWLWDGTDRSGRPVPMGAYVVVVRGGGRGVDSVRWRSLVALGRRP